VTKQNSAKQGTTPAKRRSKSTGIVPTNGNQGLETTNSQKVELSTSSSSVEEQAMESVLPPASYSVEILSTSTSGNDETSTPLLQPTTIEEVTTTTTTTTTTTPLV